MQNIAIICPDYDNHYCYKCKAHYSGYNGNLKWETRKEWEAQFDEINAELKAKHPHWFER